MIKAITGIVVRNRKDIVMKDFSAVNATKATVHVVRKLKAHGVVFNVCGN